MSHQNRLRTASHVLGITLTSFLFGACHEGTPRFRVSGVLNGLSSGSITLALNGDLEEVTLTEDGPFTFTTGLLYQDDYTITIAEMPARTLATLENATGTIESMVLDVSVALEPGYLVGGAVSGITNEPVQLRLNGGATVSVSADRSFQFPTLLRSGDSYAVEVVQAPVDRTLALSAASGTIGGSDIDDVTVRVRAWRHPSNIQESIGLATGDADDVRVAANESGDLVVAFTASGSGFGRKLFVTERTAGEWTHPTGVNDALSLENFSPNEIAVAINADGDAVVAWIQATTGRLPSVFASLRRSGTWTHPTVVTDALSPVGAQTDVLRVGIAADGEALVVWRQSDGMWRRAFLANAIGGVWQRPASTAAYLGNARQVGSLDLAVAPNGDACVAYDSESLASLGFSARIFLSERRSGTWTHPASAQAAISVTDQTRAARVATNADGDLLVCWLEWDGQEWRAMASRFVEGAWSHPTSVLDDALSPPQLEVYDMTPVVEADGSCQVFFSLNDGTNQQVAVASATAAGVWTRPAGMGDALTPPTVLCDSLSAAATAEGHLVLAAYDSNTTRSYLCERVGGVWRSDTTSMFLPDHETYDAPVLAVDGQGHVYAARVEEENNPTTSVSARLFLSEYR